MRRTAGPSSPPSQNGTWTNAPPASRRALYCVQRRLPGWPCVTRLLGSIYGRGMPLFAALLRGIAPSGTNMTNDKLRGVFEGLGLQDVASVVSSGNIVFRSSHVDSS